MREGVLSSRIDSSNNRTSVATAVAMWLKNNSNSFHKTGHSKKMVIAVSSVDAPVKRGFVYFQWSPLSLMQIDRPEHGLGEKVPC